METIKKLVTLALIFLGGTLLNYFMLFLTTVIITGFDRKELNIQSLSPYFIIVSIVYSLVYVYSYTKETGLIKYNFDEYHEKSPITLTIIKPNEFEKL